MLAGGTDGYKQAIDILNERFGNPHLVSNSIVRNLKLGKQIKTPFELRQLSDDVKNAKLVLAKLDMMAEVSCQAVIVDIVDRLPPYLQNKWCKHALDHKRSKKVYPKFDNLSEFLSEAASDMADPVSGDAFKRRKDKSNRCLMPQLLISMITWPSNMLEIVQSRMLEWNRHLCYALNAIACGTVRILNSLRPVTD